MNQDLRVGTAINSTYEFRIRGMTAAWANTAVGNHTAWSSPFTYNSASVASTANPVLEPTLASVSDTEIGKK